MCCLFIYVFSKNFVRSLNHQLATSRWFGQCTALRCLTEKRLDLRLSSVRTMSTASGNWTAKSSVHLLYVTLKYISADILLPVWSNSLSFWLNPDLDFYLKDKIRSMRVLANKWKWMYHDVALLMFLLKCWSLSGFLQDVEIVEDGAKHTLVLYNCKLPQTGEVAFTAANAKCSANLKVKGERSLPHSTFFCKVMTLFMVILSTRLFSLLHFWL